MSWPPQKLHRRLWKYLDMRIEMGGRRPLLCKLQVPQYGNPRGAVYVGSLAGLAMALPEVEDQACRAT